MTTILGISAFSRDSAAALVVDGEVVAAAEEERFTRVPGDGSFPSHAIGHCLGQAGLSPERLDYVGFHAKPHLEFLRVLETYMARAPRGFGSFRTSIPVWLRHRLHVPREIRAALGGGFSKRCIFPEHQESQAAYAFFTSPFDEAAILTLDRVGEWATAAHGTGRGNRIRLAAETRFPHSLGLVYEAFARYCGLHHPRPDVRALVDLAAHGEPRHAGWILDELVDLENDGSFRLNPAYFEGGPDGTLTTSTTFHARFGRPPRPPDSRPTRLDVDLAASIREVGEQTVLRSARHVRALTGAKRLCLGGEVALDGTAAGRILRERVFEEVWVPPVTGTAGGAVGAALFVGHQMLGGPRPAPTGSREPVQRESRYGDDEIRAFLERTDSVWELTDEESVYRTAAEAIAGGRIVAWFQDGADFGPGTAGGRGLLADARGEAMTDRLNRRAGLRDGFRRPAVAVLRERAAEIFDVETGFDSPHAMLAAPPRDARRLPALADVFLPEGSAETASVDGVSAGTRAVRIRTVDARHGRLRFLLERFRDRTGCPAVLDAGLGLGRDLVARTPRDAYEAFMSSGIDVLCMGRFVLDKLAQPASLAHAGDGGGREGSLRELMCSPCHGAELASVDGAFVCKECSRSFAEEGGIRRMYWPHERAGHTGDVTDEVKAFYEQNPFPDYDEHDSVLSLIEKSRRSGYADALQRSIPFNGTVLEVGCGTGQLSNFLGIACRRVVGTDLCLNSLRLGERFRRDHDLERVWFVQMNLFRPCFAPERFDVILCNGVLHHTSDPYGGYRGLLGLLKPGGYVVVGLYNRYGRLMTDVRRQVFRLTRGRGAWLDPVLRHRRRDDPKSRAWFADQYRHPHESKHTIGEVMGWFRDTGVDFVRGVPSVTPGSPAPSPGDLFEPEPAGTRLDHFLVQAGEMAAGSREGGFFVMIGRKPRPPA